MNLAGTETEQILSGDIVTQNSTVKAIKRATEKSTTARKIVNISESTKKQFICGMMQQQEQYIGIVKQQIQL